jgi:hypothetical protein
MTTARAQRYLATLHRQDPEPIAAVREAIARELSPPPEPWLEFHERYAGYEEPLGSEEFAVWGIVHRSPYWLAAGEAQVERSGTECYVTCAEVHPSFDYRLSATGAFSSSGGGRRARSFDVKVERDAVVWEATSGGRRWVWDPVLARTGLDRIEAALRVSGAAVVAEASDSNAVCWSGRDVVALVGKSPAKAAVLIAEDARLRFAASTR